MPSKGGTKAGVCWLLMLEQRLLEGLESGLKGGDAAERRQYHVTRSSVWELLPKGWKGLLLVALRKEEPPSEDGGGTPSPLRKQRSAGGRRMKRGRGVRSSQQGLLTEKNEALLDSDFPAAFRLAVLLVHKSRDGDSWSDSDESVMVALRSECSNGVHPVWGKMAEQTPLLAEFAAHPVKEESDNSAVSDLNDWLAGARIDPLDRSSVISFLDMELPFVLSPAAEVDLRRVKLQLNSGKVKDGRLLTAELRSLEPPASLLSGLLALASNDSAANEILKQNDIEEMEDIITDQLLLHRLRSGQEADWKNALEREGQDSLSRALRTVGWLSAPEDDIDLGLAEMRSGLELLIESNADKEASDTLRWHIVSALVKDGKNQEAEEEILQLNLSTSKNFKVALEVLFATSSEEIIAWFEKYIGQLSSDELVQLISEEKTPSSLKVVAASRLEDGTSNELVHEELIELNIETGDISGLAKILREMEDGASKHPLETLLAVNLHPATVDEELNQWILSAHSTAHEALDSNQTALGLSSLSLSLLHMLDGARCELNPLAEALDKTGIRGMREVRRAMSDDGDGLVSESNLKKLEDSIASADLQSVERRLLETVVESLRLNRIATEIQDSSNKEMDSQSFDNILSANEPRLRVVVAAREMVMEHDIALPTLVEWYQKTSPTSVWSTISKAAMHAAQGELLASARSWKQAADRPDFPYEQRIMLYRKALIHFAHSESWSEAIDLLNKEQALQSALTKRFQLYLRVSHDASRGQQEAATLSLLDFVRSQKKVMVENREGELVEETRAQYDEEELDYLFNYHRSHPVPLPSEPFQGRVRAALSNVRKDRRRSRVDDEMRYQRLMHESSQDRDLDPLIHEIYNLASDAAEENALRGLSIFERAMNSGRFKPRQIRRLQNAQQGVYQNHHKEINVRQRRHLRHLSLKPLVIVDTNILIDALKEKIAKELELSSEVRLDLVGHRMFHRTILKQRRENKIRIFMPLIVQSEIRNFAEDPRRLKAMFRDVIVEQESWKRIILKESLEKMVEEIISKFKDWKHPTLGFDDESEEYREGLNQFMLEHVEVYDRLTQQKGTHGEALFRTSLVEDDAIFPEESDLRIMLQACAIADSYHDGIGSVLVATRDGDFTLVARALEERFGFGVAKSVQQLTSWLR